MLNVYGYYHYLHGYQTVCCWLLCYIVIRIVMLCRVPQVVTGELQLPASAQLAARGGQVSGAVPADGDASLAAVMVRRGHSW